VQVPRSPQVRCSDLRSPTDFRRLLEAFLVDKALYELQYEVDNRPGWVRIPPSRVASYLARAAAVLPSGMKVTTSGAARERNKISSASVTAPDPLRASEARARTTRAASLRPAPE
jgi:hypothetical protein